jgi:hypothetical protein
VPWLLMSAHPAPFAKSRTWWGHDEEKPHSKSYQACARGARPRPRLLKRYTVARFLTFAGYAGIGLEGVCLQ